MSFIDKNIVITGAASGIGAATAKKFYKDKARLFLLDTDKKGAQLAKELGPKAFFFCCDVANSKQVKTTFNQIIKQVGQIDILVNNAGIQHYATLTETSEEDWDLVLNTNLKSAFLCSRLALPSMQETGKGVIINIASVQSFVTQQKVAAYTTSKSALLGLTRSIAVDYAPHIRAVAVCPGSVDTPMLKNALSQSSNPQMQMEQCVNMHLSQRIGNSEEVADLICYLASDKAAFITGQSFRIDGGVGVKIDGSIID